MQQMPSFVPAVSCEQSKCDDNDAFNINNCSQWLVAASDVTIVYSHTHQMSLNSHVHLFSSLQHLDHRSFNSRLLHLTAVCAFYKLCSVKWMNENRILVIFMHLENNCCTHRYAHRILCVCLKLAMLERVSSDE